MRVVAALLASLLGSLGQAQAQPAVINLPDVYASQDAAGQFEIDTILLRSCVEGARAELDRPEACIGSAAQACMEAGNWMAPAMHWCLGLEQRYWDARAALVLEDLRVIGGARDDWNFNQALEDMVAAQSVFADAACRFAGAPRFGGREAVASEVACRMRETGVFALRLEAQVLGICGGQLGSLTPELCARWIS